MHKALETGTCAPSSPALSTTATSEYHFLQESCHMESVSRRTTLAPKRGESFGFVTTSFFYPQYLPVFSDSWIMYKYIHKYLLKTMVFVLRKVSSFDLIKHGCEVSGRFGVEDVF